MKGMDNDSTPQQGLDSGYALFWLNVHDFFELVTYKFLLNCKKGLLQ